MQYLRARLDQPDWMRHPMHVFLTESDRMERAELHAWNLSRTDVLFSLFYVVGDREAYRERIDDVEDVEWYELTPVDEESFYSYVCVEYTDRDVRFFQAFAELRLVVVPPLVYGADGLCHLTAVGPGDALTTLVDSLEGDADVGVDVLEIGSYDRRHGSVTAALTDRQYEAVETATRLGYYQVPRGASLEAVAAELDVARATASELLRRAESALMARVVGVESGSTP